MKKVRFLLLFGVCVLLTLPVLSQGADVRQQLFLISQAVGAGTKIGVICQVSTNAAAVQSLMVSSKAYRVELLFFDAKTIQDVEKGFVSLLPKGIRAVIVIPDNCAGSKNGIGILAGKCKGAKIPLFGTMPNALALGALATVSKAGDGSLKLIVSKAKMAEWGVQFKPEVQGKMELQ